MYLFKWKINNNILKGTLTPAAAWIMILKIKVKWKTP